MKHSRIEPTHRSDPNKKKPNSYYQINDKIFRLSIKSEIFEGSSYNKKLKAVYEDLNIQSLEEKDKIKHFGLLIKKSKINREIQKYRYKKTPKEWYFINYLEADGDRIQYHELADKYELERDVAFELLKERGLSDPQNTIRQLIEESGVMDSI